MKDVSFFSKIFLAVTPVDFRKQAHGLAIIAEHSLDLDVTNERYLFCFTNKRKNAMKLLHWDCTGYGMWWKVLERDRFRWPKSQVQVENLSPKELKWLLEGVDLLGLKRHKKIVI